PPSLPPSQEFTDLGHRIDCLDLKGEKLDYKACEALEEVFKRLQFKVVDLEQTNLDEDGASALFDMIEYYESATHLNISFNKHIGTRGWQAAAHMMRKTSCLQYLDARNTPLLDHSAPFVARALRLRSSLAVLHLENASLSGRPLVLLATALKMNMNLRELYLADNKLNGLQDSAQLGNLLKFNCSLQILDLRNNHVLDSGLAYICEGLKEQRKGLVTLVLWNNQLTHTGMAFLGMTLVSPAEGPRRHLPHPRAQHCQPSSRPQGTEAPPGDELPTAGEWYEHTDSLGPGDRSPPGGPSSPTEQRISVSSPGRGHKVFVVTRVESPPERAEPPVPPSPRPPSPPALPSPPPSPCGLEHELSCSKNEKELEELLLEASQESGQETL
ncbi:PREDICTED: protein phosphatase 1 regulatory subunit 37, partial [Myotis davidii]|uniref:protein phosphatase 1 regulatory subunit 37 n=1 Tax=Myotis davidii TaxID=225400 RepID=UPI00076773EC